MTRWCRWLWLLCLPLLCGVALGVEAPVAQSRQIDRAERAQGAITGASEAGLQQGAAWQAVSLPDPWRLGQRSGTWTYRFLVPTCLPGTSAACLPPHIGAAMWVPRVGHSLSLWVNGHPVSGVVDGAGPSADRGQRPVLLTVPPSLLQPSSSGRDNDVRLVVSSPLTQGSGLSRVWVGTESSLDFRHTLRDVVLVGGAVATMCTSSFLTLGGLWVAWRISRDVWQFAVVSLLFGSREALWLLGGRFMPWDLAAALGDLACGAALLMACMTLLVLLNERAPVWQRVSTGVLALAPVVALWRSGHSDALADALVKGWFFLAQSMALWVTGLTVVWVARKPSRPRALILLGCVGVAIFTGLDNWFDRQSVDPVSFEYLRLAPMMATSALFVTCVSIYVRVSAALALEAHHKEAMQREIAVQRRELEALHARERERAQAEAVLGERARIVRDMHDGLGSQLVGMLSTVESGGFTREELLDELNEALSQLRLTIDSLEPIGEDLSSLLGQLRFRLDARLRKAGFKVMWDVMTLPVDTRLSASHINHLQRLLYETFSNIIKHSGARNVWVHASHDESAGINKIVIRDDGCGFDAGRPEGRGLRNLAHRAGQLDADLDVSSRPGQGTQVSLCWAVGAL